MNRDKKNIIVLITDTFRHDNLGDRARRQVRTPELDRFASLRASEIGGFYMNSFPTVPHRTDFTSGVLGWPHYGWQQRSDSSPNHLPVMLSKQGYTTQLICDCPHLFANGFQNGFDASFQHPGQEGYVRLLRMNEQIPNAIPPEKTRADGKLGKRLVDLHRWTNNIGVEEETFSYKTAATTTRWLEENHRSGPFFLWVDMFDPHEPWDLPEYLVRHYDPTYDGPPMLHPNYGRSSVYSDAELKNLWAHYAAESELVDRHIGRILQKMDDLELWQNSVVVLMADHGISIGEHNRTGKSNRDEADNRYWPIYPEIGHAPFFVAGESSEGTIRNDISLDLIAQPIDLVPTLCELAGVNIEPPQPLEGRSFAEAVLAGSGQHREYAVSGCHVEAPGGKPPRGCTTPFVVTDRWGYAPVGADGSAELYNLDNDPFTEQDVAGSHTDVVAEVHQLLRSHLKEHRTSTEFLDLWERPGDGSGNGVWAVDYAE